jgi:ribose-phosphate pyrophosphokinase
MSQDAAKLLFTSSRYEYLRAAFFKTGTFDEGHIESKTFPDGEVYRRILDDPWGRDVVLLGGTPHDTDWLEIYDLGCGISRAGARSLSIVIPYFGYSTMERAVKPGDIVSAKTRARLISAIPPCEGGTRTFLFDLHTDGIEFYFSDAHVTHHVYGSPIITALATDVAAGRDFVLGATDAGRAKWVESLARKMGCEPAFVYKRRDSSTGDLTVTGVNASVNGRVVVIYDDMIRTGSSLLQAASAYLDAGATEVHAVVSHLVLPGDALDRLLDDGRIGSINGTDSHPKSVEVRARGGRIASVAPLLVSGIERS